MYNNKKNPGGRVYKGGSSNFNEATGQYNRPVPAPSTKPAMSKPQARMAAMKKRMGM